MEQGYTNNSGAGIHKQQWSRDTQTTVEQGYTNNSGAGIHKQQWSRDTQTTVEQGYTNNSGAGIHKGGKLKALGDRQWTNGQHYKGGMGMVQWSKGQIGKVRTT